MSTLRENSILVRLKLSAWTGVICDRKVSDSIDHTYKTFGKAGKYKKFLVAEEEIKKINKRFSAINTFHRYNTVPWLDDGVRILPIDNHLDYMKEIKQLKAKLNDEVDSFCNKYSQLIKDSKMRLGEMFSDSDYPSVSTIRAKYGAELTMFPIPSSEDFRVKVDEESLTTMKQELESKLKMAHAEAMKDVWTRLYDVVKHMSDKLNNRNSKFKNSLVDNISELVEILPKLNLNNDPNLKAFTSDVKNKLTKCDPEDLRTDENERAKVAKEASDIMNKMKGFI